MFFYGIFDYNIFNSLRKNNNEILKAFQDNIEKTLSKNILFRVVPALFIILFFVYNDYFVIKSIESVFFRFIVMVPLFIIILLKLFLKNKESLIFWVYTFTLSIMPVMMYGKLIIHFGDPQQLFLSILGTILIIFIMSLELKLKLKYSILIYTIPFIIFIFIFYYSVGSMYFTYRVSLNIFPIIILGFMANLLFNKLIFSTFKSKYLLKEEKYIVEAQNEELKVLNKTKDRFFSIISHDLKNPFNVIMGFSEVLKDGYNSYSDKERKHFIDEINNSSVVVYELLDNLLKWSSLQLNGIVLKKESINLKTIINEIISTQELNAKVKSINIINSVKTDITITADKQSILTILGNLIGNAVKFSFENSDIIVNADVKDKQVVFSVQDFGVGIEKDIVDKLFKIDENHSTVGTKNERGNGLGLILCKEIVNQNQGEIWLESSLGKGSTFFFSLPI